MDCADCAVKLQGALRREPGVQQADVNFGAATLALVLDPERTDLTRMYTAVRRLGYDTVERTQAGAAASAGGDGRSGGRGSAAQLLAARPPRRGSPSSPARSSWPGSLP